jgi:sterol desaturase/sphingolipid hydroxylase (fatty acid hydroxylase superfamily)
MRSLVARWLLFSVVAASFAAYLVARSIGGNLELTVLVSAVVTFALGAILERAMPFERRWNESHADARTDLASAAFLIGVVDPLFKYAGPIAVVAIYGIASPSGGLAIFPREAPLAVQLILAAALIELGRYWAHRWHHSSRYLWWLHALHHGSERLYSLNNFRFHPLNYAVNFLMSVFPLMLAGVPGDVLLGYLAVSQPVLMLQHANIDLRSGWLNHVFSTNEVHRWHHSGLTEEANRNYGSAFIVWDIVFGTFKYQASGNAPGRIGLFSQNGHYPASKGYVAQLLSLFSPQCCKA